MRDIFRDSTLQQNFDRDGFVVVRFGDPDAIDRLTKLHDGASADQMTSRGWSYTGMTDDAAYRRKMSTGILAAYQPHIDEILDRCRAIFGNFFEKQPSAEESRIHLHQDWSWVDERQHHSLTIWCPLHEVNEANGTLSVVPGSHRLSEQPRGFVTRFPYPELEPLFVSRYSRRLDLEPGQAVFFHQRLFHWSGPNHSQRRRLAATCFVAPEEAIVRFPYPDPRFHPDQIELFEVDDDLMASFALGVRPEHARSVGMIDAKVDPVDEEALERILGPVAAPAPFLAGVNP